MKATWGGSISENIPATNGARTYGPVYVLENILRPARDDRDKMQSIERLELNQLKTMILFCCALCVMPSVVFGEKPLSNDGRKVTVFTKIVAPAGLSVSPAGEVFVSSDPNGATRTEEGIGSIHRFIDTDGDGVADKQTTFVSKINSPRGMCFVDGTLYVVHPPFLSAFRDEDGDGVAEIKKILVKRLGFDYKYRGADHSSNDVRMGIDGWLYLAIGDYGLPGATGTDGKQVFHRGGCVARVRPDGTEFEIFAAGTRNIYDIAVDPYLNAFTRDNTNDSGGWNVRLNHITAMANYGYPSLFMNFNDEIMQPLADFGGGSGTGALYLHEPGFPPHLSDSLLTADYGVNMGTIFYHPLKPNSASFKLTGYEARPGELYPQRMAKKGDVLWKVLQVTDMDVDGHSHLFAAGYAHASKGYVARLSFPGIKPAVFPNLKEASDEDLLGHLTARSQVCRLNAQRELLNRGSKPMFVEGLAQIAAGEEPLYARVAALFALKQLEGVKSHGTLIQLASRKDLHEFALRALADRKTQLADAPTKLFVDALDDSNPRVRLQALIGLARIDQTDSASAVVPLLIDADPVIAHTAVKALVAMRAVESVLRVMESGKPSPSVESAVRALKQMHDPKVVDTLIGLYAQHKDTDYRQHVLNIMFRLYYREAPWEWQSTTKGKWWWLIRPDSRGPYYARETWSQSEKIGKFLEKEFLRETNPTILAAYIEQFQLNRLYIRNTLAKMLKFGEENDSLRQSVARFVVANEVYNPAAVRLVARAAGEIDLTEVSTVQEECVKYLAADNEGFKSAMELIYANGELTKPGYRLGKFYWRLMLRGEPSLANHVSYFLKQTTSTNRTRRIMSYAALLCIAHHPTVPTRWHGTITEQTKKEVNAFVEAALLDESLSELLLESIAQTYANGRSCPVENLIKPYAGFVETQLDSKNESVKLLAEKFAKSQFKKYMKRTAPDNRTTIGSLLKKSKYEQVIATISKTKGDAKKGQIHFAKCMACHTTKANETPKGPSLAGISNRYDQKYILDSIMKPSAVITQGYVSQLFRMKDGSDLVGFISNQGAEVVEVRDATGTVAKLRIENIDEQRQLKASIMPEGLVNEMTVEEFASLLAYLNSLK